MTEVEVNVGFGADKVLISYESLGHWNVFIRRGIPMCVCCRYLVAWFGSWWLRLMWNRRTLRAG